MSFPNISDILSEYNRDGSNNNNHQKSGIALSQTGEIEIKDLLKRIDTMINQKKLRWERQRQELDNRMQLKDQENMIQKAALEQKTYEISQLKVLLENMNSKTHDMMKKYENEIEKLNEQLNKTKSDYIKIHKKYKQNKENNHSNNSGGGGGASGSNRRSDRLATPSRAAAAGVNSLNSSLSDIIMETQMETHQKHKYEHEITTLKSQLNEHKLKEMELYHEKESLKKQMDNLKEVNLDLHRKVNELSKTQNFVYGEKMFYETELRKKDEVIKNLESSRPVCKTNDINDLKVYKEEVKKYKTKENTVRHELNKLKVEYNEAMKRLNVLEMENRKIKSKPNTSEDRNKNNEIINLKKKINSEKEQHLQEVQLLKNEIYSFTNQITEKNNHIRNLTEKINVLERVIKEKEEMFEKTNQELTMTLAHVDALRLENHFLRQSAIEKRSDERDVVDMQKKYNEVIELTEKENKRLKNEVISLTQVIEELRKNVQNETKNAENADLNYRRLKVLKDDYEKQIELIKQQYETSAKRLNSEIQKLHGEKYSLISELDAVKLQTNGHKNNRYATNNNNITASHSTTTLSDGTLHSGISNNNNNNEILNSDDMLKKLRLNYNSHNNLTNNASDLHPQMIHHHQQQQQHSHHQDDLPISSRSEAFNSDTLFKQPNNKRTNLIINNDENSPNNYRLSFGSQLRLDEQKRKKELENLLESHIETLRKSSGGIDNILGVNSNITNANYVKS